MIEGSNFRIRTIMQSDLDDLLFLLSDTSKQGDYLPFDMWSQARMREAFIKDGFWSDKDRRLLIVDGEERIIGSVWIMESISYFDAYELGYRLFDRAHWGKGIITEAMRLTIDFVFAAFKVNRLEIRCDVENKASVRVAEKLGFQHEGIARQAMFARGRHRDMHLFAMLRQDWTLGYPASGRPEETAPG